MLTTALRSQSNDVLLDRERSERGRAKDGAYWYSLVNTCSV
jgi:hypothetical protein